MDHRQHMEDGAHAGYAVVPNDILTELLKLGEVAFKLWVCLARRCYGDRLECWPKIAVLEQELGFSRRAIFNALAELENAKLVTRQSRFRSDGSQTSTVYLLARGASPSGASSCTPRGESSCTPGGESRCTPIPLKKNKIEETQDEETKNGRAHSFIDDTTSRVIAYLNQTAGRRFDPTGGNCKHLRARVREAGPRGAEVFEANARRVIDLKVNEWGSDAKMSKFLRPETLFNSEKWPTYLEESSRSSNGRYLMTQADIEREAANLR